MIHTICKQYIYSDELSSQHRICDFLVCKEESYYFQKRCHFIPCSAAKCLDFKKIIIFHLVEKTNHYCQDLNNFKKPTFFWTISTKELRINVDNTINLTIIIFQGIIYLWIIFTMCVVMLQCTKTSCRFNPMFNSAAICLNLLKKQLFSKDMDRLDATAKTSIISRILLFWIILTMSLGLCFGVSMQCVKKNYVLAFIYIIHKTFIKSINIS